MKSEPPKRKVETVYLIRSYDHDERTTPRSLPSRKSTWRTTRSNTQVSANGTINTRGRETVAFKRDINYGNADPYQIWEVARAATAAPLYFEPLKIRNHRSEAQSVFMDAGYQYTTNPTEEGALEIEDLYGKFSIGVVVSVGTARRDEPWGGGIRRNVKTVFNKASNSEVVHNKMRDKAANDGFQYYRLNDRDALDIDLDEWKPKPRPFVKDSGSKTINKIENAFGRWASRYDIIDQLQKCAAELVNRRKARATDFAKWERYAIGAQFRCRFKECERGDFANRRDFHNHLVNDHDMQRTELDQEADFCRKYWRYQKAESR